jgi:hypothetical protein
MNISSLQSENMLILFQGFTAFFVQRYVTSIGYSKGGPCHVHVAMCVLDTSDAYSRIFALKLSLSKQSEESAKS